MQVGQDKMEGFVDVGLVLGVMCEETFFITVFQILTEGFDESQ